MPALPTSSRHAAALAGRSQEVERRRIRRDEVTGGGVGAAAEPREDELLKAVNAGLDEARVLVVEDDEAMRTFLDESLREEGYIVRTASNTLSAIVTLLADRADILVIDWKMPDLDGFALLSAVRRCFPELPVIFVTAFARPEIERRALEAGGVSVFSEQAPPL